jgi:hypothetical protein
MGGAAEKACSTILTRPHRFSVRTMGIFGDANF